MFEEQNGNGYFKEVTLNPVVIVKSSDMIEKAIELHKRHMNTALSLIL